MTIAVPCIWVNPFNQQVAILHVNIFVLPAAVLFHGQELSMETETALLKVNVEISTFRGRSQGLPRGRNISSSTQGRIVLPL